MNLIHLRSSDFFGGPERAILGQCRNMPSVNFICASFIRGDQANPFLEKAAELNLKTETIAESFAGDFRVIKKIRALIEKHKADIIISHDYKANFFAQRAVKNSPAKHIIHFRGYTTEDSKVKLYNFIDNKTLKKADQVLVVSKKSGRLLESKGVPAEKIKVVYNAIEGSKLLADDYKRTVKNNKKIIITAAGRLSYEKGIDVLLEAVGLLNDTTYDFEINLYGHGPEENNLKLLVKKLKIEDKINFKGFVENILPVLNESDFLVLPSRSEGLPNIVLEAWSQKLGVVATAVGGLPEMITHKENGLLSGSEDYQKLADNIEFALENRELLNGYGELGYRKLLDQFSYKTQSEQLLAVYSKK